MRPPLDRVLIGINARLFPSNWRPARDEITFASANGFDCIQLPGQIQGLDSERLGDSFKTIAAALRAANLVAVMEIVALINPEGYTRLGTTPLEVLETNLPAITALPCERVHLHLAPSERAEDWVWEALEQRLASQFAAGVELAKEHGFQLGFEHNEPDIHMFPTVKRCAALLEAVPGLGLVWDFNHTPLDEVPTYLGLAERISMLHVSDTPLPDVNYHYPLGMGTIDFERYCQGLLDGGFAGPAILEIGGLPKSGGYGRDTDEALIDSGQRLRRAFGRDDV
jgi:L-ribulose-5-phosphate 3-epimerase